MPEVGKKKKTGIRRVNKFSNLTLSVTHRHRRENLKRLKWDVDGGQMRTCKVEKFRAFRVRNFAELPCYAVSNSNPSCHRLCMCCVLGAVGCSSHCTALNFINTQSKYQPHFMARGLTHKEHKYLPNVLNLLNGRSDSKVHERSITIITIHVQLPTASSAQPQPQLPVNQKSRYAHLNT